MLHTISAPLPALVLAAATAASAPASVFVTTSYGDWQAAVGAPITQLTFEGIAPFGSGFHTQYASYGVIDPEPNDLITLEAGRWTLQSLSSPPPTITFVFSMPITAVGWTSIVNQTASLFLGNSLVAAAVPMPGTAGWTFAGLVSDVAFDKVVITHPVPGGGGILDDLWFPTIPAPPVALLGIFAVMRARSRRR